MSLWLVRAGKSGEYERKFLTEGSIYLTWDGLKLNLENVETGDNLSEKLNEIYNG